MGARLTDKGNEDGAIHNRRTHRWIDLGRASDIARLLLQQEGSVTIRIKRTTPFAKQCTFMLDLGDVLERCEEDAERGFYYGNDVVVNMISLCLFHAVYQESLWLGDEDE